MAQQEPIRKRSGPGGSGSQTGSTREIPDKLYFRIGEVARLCEVPAYVLRFWEGEFPQLKPNKGGTGQRLYRRRDVETALRIKNLLYDRGYTIPGARQVFKSELRTGQDPQLALNGVADQVDVRHLAALRKELQELHGLLSKPAVPRTPVQPIRRMPAQPKPESSTPRQPARPQLISRPSPNLFDPFPPDDDLLG